MMAEPINAVFPDGFTAAAWRQHWCDRCFQPDEAQLRLLGKGTGCPIFSQARDGRLPREWFSRLAAHGIRRFSEALPHRLYDCDAFRKQPPVYRRPRAQAEGPQEELFPEPKPGAKSFVPVDGWPEPPDAA